jgi:hypothetical protein
MSPDAALDVALIHQTAHRRVTIAEGRGQQFATIPSRRATGDSLKALAACRQTIEDSSVFSSI